MLRVDLETVLTSGKILMICSSILLVYGRNEACGVIIQMKISWAVLSQEAICILQNKIIEIFVKMTLVSSGSQ